MNGNIVTSSLFVSFTRTWIRSLGERMKTRLALFVNITVKEDGVRCTEFVVFHFCVLPISILQYVPIYLCLNIFPIQSNFKYHWRSETDVNIPTCLYLMHIYTLNIFVNLSSKRSVVNVSCIMRCVKSLWQLLYIF